MRRVFVVCLGVCLTPEEQYYALEVCVWEMEGGVYLCFVCVVGCVCMCYFACMENERRRVLGVFCVPTYRIVARYMDAMCACMRVVHTTLNVPLFQSQRGIGPLSCTNCRVNRKFAVILSSLFSFFGLPRLFFFFSNVFFLWFGAGVQSLNG